MPAPLLVIEVAIGLFVAGAEAPAKVPSPKAASTPSSSAQCPPETPVTLLVKLPLPLVFQTTYWPLPLLKATSYPFPVWSAPTGVQPAAPNVVEVTALPLSSSSGPVPVVSEVSWNRFPTEFRVVVLLSAIGSAAPPPLWSR